MELNLMTKLGENLVCGDCSLSMDLTAVPWSENTITTTAEHLQERSLGSWETGTDLPWTFLLQKCEKLQ
ncbi:hypothetical protein DV515_00013560 [Chloebia gouldiae]|uniref:Uncharacterized protein n=1 Tax=Chloebia gouldiae TaxID=44316 RepID=A0A3L8S161_CHLGU|nr:hypothetical protein DV515_00013560 [Chloebia gouldiae]